jgi:hypothetical protein
VCAAIAKLFSAKARRESRVVANGLDLFDDPALPSAVADAEKGRLETGRALLAESVADYELRGARLGMLSTAVVPHLSALSKLYAEKPDDADLALWFGAAQLDRAWDVRGGAIASLTSQRKFEEFWLILGRAYEPLARAAELRPDDPVPWDRMQWHGLGAQRPREELDEIWAELQRRGPDYFGGHSSRLQVLCEKWQGSNKEVNKFAITAAAQAPTGSPIPALLVVKDIELASAHQVGPVRYFRQYGVLAELAKAADAWCEKPDGNVGTAAAHHLFGFAFWAGGDPVRARRHLSRVSAWSIPHNLPWRRYSGNPAALYLGARKELGVPDDPILDLGSRPIDS